VVVVSQIIPPLNEIHVNACSKKTYIIISILIKIYINLYFYEHIY
jgi:hypothetical protein